MLVSVKLLDRIVDHKIVRFKFDPEDGYLKLRDFIVEKLKWTDKELVQNFCIGYFDVYLDLISIVDTEDLKQCNQHRLDHHKVKYMRLILYRESEVQKMSDEFRNEHRDVVLAIDKVTNARLASPLYK